MKPPPPRRHRWVIIVLIGIAFFALTTFRMFGFPPTLWRERTAADAIRFRTNNLSGYAQVQTTHGWQSSFEKEGLNAATPTEEQLKTITVREFAWETGGSDYLVGRVFNASDTALQGRIAFAIVVKDKSGQFVSDRTIRKVVHWPARQESVFALSTGLAHPQPGEKTTLALRSIFTVD